MIYEKECPICGSYFKTTTKIRKYCDKCIDNSGRKAEKAYRELSRSRREHPLLNLISYNCEYCGRNHTVEERLVSKVKISSGSRFSWDGKDHYYCCIDHMNQDRHDHYKCSKCGKLLKGSEYSFSPFRELNYCSSECEEADNRDRGYYHTCQNCGKEFFRKSLDAKYCSKKCSSTAYHATSSPRKDTFECSADLVCSECGNSFTRRFKAWKDYFDEINSSKHFCSEACSNKHKENLKLQYKNVPQIRNDDILDPNRPIKSHPRTNLDLQYLKDELAVHNKAIEEIQEKINQLENNQTFRVADSEECTLSLCATCKVSYKNCERMQSDFRIIPKGAHYNNKGLLVECPKYKER